MAQRIVGAHEPGPRVNLNDGTTTYGGVRAMTMRADGATMLTGGADGWVHTWELADGTIAGGMIPKVASCTHAVRHGVNNAHILDGRIAHVLLLEIFTDSGIGTMVRGSQEATQ